MANNNSFFNVIDDGAFYRILLSEPLQHSPLLIVGSSGCIEENTKVFLNDNKEVRIKDLPKDAVFSLVSYNLKDKKFEQDQAILIDSGIKEVYEVELENGHKILATKDHIFFYDGKAKPLEKFIENQMIDFVDDGKDCSYCSNKHHNSKFCSHKCYSSFNTGQNNVMKRPEIKNKHLSVMQSDIHKQKVSEGVKRYVNSLTEIERKRIYGHCGKDNCMSKSEIKLRHKEKMERLGKEGKLGNFGNRNGFFGKKWEEYGGHPKGASGMKHSPNSKEKISKSSLIRWKNKEYIEKQRWSSERRKKLSNSRKTFFNTKEGLRMKKNLKKSMKKLNLSMVLPFEDTKIEKKIQKFLDKLNIKYFKHKIMKIKSKYRSDIFVPSFNLVIECDGCYWHSCPECFPKKKINNVDIIRTIQLKEKGLNVLRLWEHDIRKMDINNFKNILGGFVEKKKN